MDQAIIFIILTITLILFIWGKIRYDLVALLALFVLVVLGYIPFDESFSGFAHPAVVTVAAVLVISQAFQHSGLVDIIARWLALSGKSPILQILLLSLVVTVASAFINNIGALAIMMPVAVHMARKSGYPPSLILMPLAFASLLGGMTTLIGTPPNIIISTFRQSATGEAFNMFDFSPVGISITIVGLLFITLFGRKLLPRRQSKKSSEDLFQIENYITEVLIVEDSKLIGKQLYDMNEIAGTDVQLLGLIRNGVRIHAPEPAEKFKLNDILIIEADTSELKNFIEGSNSMIKGGDKIREVAKGSDEIQTSEAIVMGDSPMIGHTPKEIELRSRYHLNLLAIARKERKIIQRIGKTKLKAGDVLLLQGRSVNITDAMTALHCLPLAERGVTIGKPRRTIFAISLFTVAVSLVVMNILPVQIAFSIAAVMMVLANVLPINEFYTSIDWPVIILLGAMMPVAEAFETSGSAELITAQMHFLAAEVPIWIILGILMVSTIALSNVINNAAAAVLMAPIAINIARAEGLSVDPFLMTIAVAASCAFLTPIGHQSNTIVMGPGGYRFSDYWKLGLPVTLIVIAASIPMILYFWPV